MLRALAGYLLGGILNDSPQEAMECEAREVNDWLVVNMPNKPEESDVDFNSERESDIDEQEILEDRDIDFDSNAGSETDEDEILTSLPILMTYDELECQESFFRAKTPVEETSVAVLQNANQIQRIQVDDFRFLSKGKFHNKPDSNVDPFPKLNKPNSKRIEPSFDKNSFRYNLRNEIMEGSSDQNKPVSNVDPFLKLNNPNSKQIEPSFDKNPFSRCLVDEIREALSAQNIPDCNVDPFPKLNKPNSKRIEPSFDKNSFRYNLRNEIMEASSDQNKPDKNVDPFLKLNKPNSKRIEPSFDKNPFSRCIADEIREKLSAQNIPDFNVDFFPKFDKPNPKRIEPSSYKNPFRYSIVTEIKEASLPRNKPDSNADPFNKQNSKRIEPSFDKRPIHYNIRNQIMETSALSDEESYNFPVKPISFRPPTNQKMDKRRLEIVKSWEEEIEPCLARFLDIEFIKSIWPTDLVHFPAKLDLTKSPYTKPELALLLSSNHGICAPSLLRILGDERAARRVQMPIYINHRPCSSVIDKEDLKKHLQDQIKELRPSQQAKALSIKKQNSRSQLKRHNQNYIYCTSAKASRRKDLQRNHSGANNNRKC